MRNFIKMIRNIPLPCLFFLSMVLPAPALAADVDITLQMIMDAPKKVDYEGVLMTQRYGEDEEPIRITQRVVHQQPDKIRIDYLDTSTMEKNVKIQIKHDIYQRETKGDSLFYSHRLRRGENVVDFGLGFSSLDLLETNYQLDIEGKETILDRSVVKLSIQPIHPGRNSKVAWIDQETGLVLRTENRNRQGNLVEEVFFSSITVNPKIDEAVFSTDEWAGRMVEVNQVIACGSMQEVQQEAGFALAAPVFIPAGFTLDRLRVILYANQPTAYFTYTDGLSHISLFQRFASPTDQAAKAWPGGTPNIVDDVQVWKASVGAPTSIMRFNDNFRLYTMISNISDVESVKMVKSMRVINSSAALESPDANITPWFIGGVMVGLLAIGGWIVWRRRSF